MFKNISQAKARAPGVRGSGGKMTIFSNGSFDQCKYPDPLIYPNMIYIKFHKKNEWKEPFGGIKVDIFWFLLTKWVQFLDFCGF